MKRGLLLALFWWQSLPCAAWDSKANCDNPSPSIKEFKAESQEKCQEACETTKDCKGIVYITGWQKCQLKANEKKQLPIRFASGDLNDKHAYEKGSFKFDQDHSGKDLERLVLSDADQCGDACAAKAECQSFTFLEGYRVCWLKKKGGKLSNKVFHCATRQGV